MSDKDVLVEDDECQAVKDVGNGVVINVAPFNGVENAAFEQDSVPKFAAARPAEEKTRDFIMAIFVVVFDTKRGRYEGLELE